MEDIFTLLLDNPYFQIVSAVVTLASAIVAVSKKPQEGTPLAKVFAFINFLALNIGRAKTPNTVRDVVDIKEQPKVIEAEQLDSSTAELTLRINNLAEKINQYEEARNKMIDILPSEPPKKTVAPKKTNRLKASTKKNDR